MLGALEELVMVESPSAEPAATAACAAELAGIGSVLLGEKPERLQIEGRVHLRWGFEGTPRVLLVGHFDTVWPLGTVKRWPYAVEDGRATGPGIFDMKAGLVQALYAVASLQDRSGVQLLFTSDEELGSITSRATIEAMARGAAAALVLEPSRKGALKVARKGVSFYHLHFTGAAAHASEATRGANAMLEMAHQVVAIERLARPELGTTLTPTLASAGLTQNTVPAAAYAYIDVRVGGVAEQIRVDDEIRALPPHDPRVLLSVTGGPNRPPMSVEATRDLFDRARRCAGGLGLELPADGIEASGGSDGNFTAAMGTPTLDGLGAVGDHAHAEGEYVEVARMPERAALLAALIEDVRAA
ncbi:MAG: M20/M25/M40 family metallo-hydrolase [Candidatus Dormibacteraeota bacterium]|nr:M20/M25/M40 family metallo-hydrolase [Candidatus Dormibacteraeota bacterium]